MIPKPRLSLRIQTYDRQHRTVTTQWQTCEWFRITTGMPEIRRGLVGTCSAWHVLQRVAGSHSNTRHEYKTHGLAAGTPDYIDYGQVEDYIQNLSVRTAAQGQG